MSVELIPDGTGRGFILAIEADEADNVDPIAYYSQAGIQKLAIMKKIKSPIRAFLPDEYFLLKAKQDWAEEFKRLVKIPVQENFRKLFNAESKSEQERLMNGAHLTPEELISLFFFAGSVQNCTFSTYLTEKLPKGIKENDLPKIAKLDGDKIFKVGKTTLTDGQLKNLINQRKVLIAKFLDNKEGWHCFFQTYKGIAGEEKGAIGRSHLHYLSDKWGYNRADVVGMIKTGEYPGTKVHIDLIGYVK